MEESLDFYARNDDLKKRKSDLAHYQAVDPKITEWTDEKHTLYLKTMEALFVDQLYESLDLDTERNYQVVLTASRNQNQQHKLMQREPDGGFSASNAKASPPTPPYQLYQQNEHRFRYQGTIHGYAEVMDQNF